MQPIGNACPSRRPGAGASSSGTSATRVPCSCSGSRAVIVPSGEITQVSPVAAQRTSARRFSTDRICASNRCCWSVSVALKEDPLMSDKSTFAALSTSDAAAEGTMSS
jgi:hypothetical protein